MTSEEVPGRRASEGDISMLSLETSEDEQYSSDHEFLVECILSEKVQDGETLYLIEWTGYPREMSTWEPPENIQDPGILKTWEERKSLQQKGDEAIFDVEGFEAQKKQFEEAKALRSRLRHEKRETMRLALSEGHENETGSVYAEPTVGPLQSPKRQSPPRSLIGERRNSAPQNAQQGTKRKKVQRRIISDDDSSEDEPLTSVRSRGSISKSASAAMPSVKETSSSKQNVPSRRAVQVDASHRASASDASTKTAPVSQKSSTKGLENTTHRGGRGATRGASSLLPKNVFAGGRTRQRKPTLLESATDSSKNQKHFSQVRMIRRAELAGRQLADKAPDIEALPGGLFDPSKNVHVQPIRPGILKKYSSANQEDEDLLQSEPTTKQSRQHTYKETSTQSTKPKEIPWQDIPWERRTICFWWSRNIRCEYGNSCKFLHINDPSLPVAPPPDSWVEYRRPCAFYNRPGGCNKGDSCTFLHENLNNTTTTNNNTVGGSDLQSALSLPMSGSVVEQSKICYWWFIQGHCRKGDTCDFAHTLDSTRTIAVPHRLAREPCLASLRGECRNSREDCPKVHAHSSHDPEPVASVAPVAPMAPLMSEAPPVAPNFTPVVGSAPSFNAKYSDQAENAPFKLREQDVCLYWKKGQCRNSAATCRWAHGVSAETPTLNQSHIRSSIHQGSTGAAKPTVHFAPDLFEHLTDYGMPTIENTEEVIMPPQDRNSNTVPMSNPLESNTIRPRSKVLDSDESQQKIDRGALNNRLKMVIFGAGSNKPPIKVDFGELPTGSPWGNTCANFEVIRFDQMCTAQDFYLKYKSPQHLWEGHLGTDPAESGSRMIIGQVAENLRLGSTGLLATCDGVAILVHPASTEEWKDLGNTASPPSNYELRYLVFDLDKLIASSTTSPDLITARVADQPSSKNEDLLPPCKPKVVKTLYGLNYKTLRDLDYDNSRLNKKARNADNFFLIFPTSATHLADFIAAWLRSCRKQCKVYNSQIDGAWDYFVHSSSISAGAILVYETVLASLSELPWTRELTVQNNFLFWCIGDSTSSAPLSLHPKINGVPNFGQITIRPLFPFGAAIFVTPSFLVAEPAMTYKLFTWFQNRLKNATSGSYKLVSCHDLRTYLLDLAVQKSRDRDDLLETYHNLPEKHAMASEKGLSHEDCQLRFDVFRLFVDILESDLLSGLSTVDLDPSEDGIIPVRYAPASIDPDNEKELVSWFAGWTILNLGTHRKFYVVGSSTKNSTRAIKMVPELGENTSSTGIPKIPSISSSEIGGGNQGGVPADSLGGNEGASKTQAGQNGSSMPNDVAIPSTSSIPSPHSAVGDGTHTSTSETMSSIHNQSDETRITSDQDTDVIGALSHPPLQETTNDLDGPSTAAGTMQTPSSEYLRTAMKPLSFETTDVWYQRYRTEKQGWEHICVDKWERVLSLLGVVKNASS